MDKNKISLICSSVLEEMAASRKRFKQFSSWSQAYQFVNQEFSFSRASLKQHGLELKPELELKRLAAQCLLAVAECSVPELTWDKVFHKLFETIGKLDYSEETFEDAGAIVIFEECIHTNFIDFKNGYEGNNINPEKLYAIAAHCVLLISHINSFRQNGVLTNKGVPFNAKS